MKPWLVRLAAFSFAISALVANAAPRVLPSGENVPENLLRIELELDHPLTAPLDMTQVALLDSTGQPIVDALLDLPLPSRDGKRISILLHPGRIKTGVGPNVAFGMALRSGERVTLVVADPQFATPLRKSWLVIPALRAPIDATAWSIATPASRSRAPLQVSFPIVLDSSAQDLIAIADANGERVAGRAALSADEMRWDFIPAKPWKAGRYALRVHPFLEDPQGNRMCAAFEQTRQSAVDCEEDARVAFTLK